MPLSERVISAEQARHFQAWHTRELQGVGISARGLAMPKRAAQSAGAQAAEDQAQVDPVASALQKMAEEREALDLRIAALRDWEQGLQEREQSLDIRESRIADLEQEAYIQGEEKGRCAGYAAGWSGSEQERAQWLALHADVSAEVDALKTRAAEQCLGLGVEIARKVLMDSIALDDSSAAKVLKKLHEDIVDDLEKMTLTVHPSQLEWFRKQLPDLPHFAGARLVADASLNPAGFRIQHSEGGLDCSLEKRWQRVLAAIGSEHASGDLQP